MKKSELRYIIREEIRKSLFEEEAEKAEGGIDSKINITQLVKKLEGVEVPKFNTAFKKLQNKKPLGNIDNKVMTDVFIAFMKNDDITLFNKFREAFKKIK